jgi:dolichol kinase
VLIEATGIPATHNAWMFLAVVAGLPLTLLVLQFVARHALSLARRRTVEGWLALQVIGLFMFEEFFRATVFVILTMWLVAAPAAARLRRPVPAAAGGVRPGLAPSLQA